jgi:hypothetical protein
MHRVRRLLPLCILLAASSLVDCADLGRLPQDACGNGVVDSSEDCDGFAPESGTRCAAAGETNACRFTCGSGATCPKGWGCGNDTICRAASGKFAVLAQTIPSTAWKLAAGDFDGDGRADLVAVDPYPAGPSVDANVLFLDPALSLAATRPLPRGTGMPSVVDLDRDGLDDLVLASVSGGAVRLFGRRDRTFAGRAEVSLSYPKATVQPLYSPSMGAVAFVKTAGRETSLYGMQVDAPPKRLAVLGVPLDAPKSIAVVTTASGEFVAFAEPSASEFLLYPTTWRDGAGVHWNEAGIVSSSIKSNDAQLTGDIMAADVDMDGNSDIVLGANGGLAFVALGNAGGSFARPSMMRINGDPLQFPLAIADFNGDGLADFAVDDRLLTSDAAHTDAEHHPFATDIMGGLLVAAVAADLNSDGRSDLAVARETGGIEVIAFRGREKLHTVIPTAFPIEMLAAGDVDGDFFSDLIAIDVNDDLEVFYGSPGLPEATPLRLHIAGAASVLTTTGASASNGSPAIVVASAPDRPRPNATTSELTWVLTGRARQLVSPILTAPATFSIAAGRFTDDSALGAIVVRAPSLPFTDAPSAVLLRQAPDASSWQPFAEVALDRGGPAFDFPAVAGDIDHSGVDSVVTLLARRFGDVEAIIAKAEPSAGWALHTVARVTLADYTRGHPPLAVGTDGRVALADLNDDGYVDLIVQGRFIDNVGSTKPDSKVTAYLNDGAGQFGRPVGFPIGAEAAAVVHVGASGPLGLAYVASNGAAIARWDDHELREGDRVLRPNGGEIPGTGITTGDFDGDGVDDLAIADGQQITIARGLPVRP